MPRSNDRPPERKPTAKQTSSRPRQAPEALGNKERRHSVLKFVLECLGALAALFGIVTGTLFFRADVSIEPYSSLDDKLPFSEQLYVQNTSVFAIYDVASACAIRSTRTPGTPERRFIFLSKEHQITPPPQIPRLESGSRTTAYCALSEEDPVHQIYEITVEAHYRVPIWGRRCKAADFNGTPGSGGKYVWRYESTHECPVFPSR